MSTPKRITALLAAILAFGLTESVASAPSAADDAPSYSVPSYASAEQTIHGRISVVDGAYRITVDDDNGYQDAVELHHGTIINPTGLTLTGGMNVTILGYNGGSVFVANEIDTPYTYSGPAVVPVYYGPGWWYPGFAYGYGPRYNLVIINNRPVYRPFVRRPIPGPIPEPRPWAGHPYVGHPVAGHPHPPQ
jgi:hypothetical protein